MKRKSFLNKLGLGTLAAALGIPSALKGTEKLRENDKVVRWVIEIHRDRIFKYGSLTWENADTLASMSDWGVTVEDSDIPGISITREGGDTYGVGT